MYCGEMLPPSMHMSAAQVKAHLASTETNEQDHAEFLEGMSRKLPHQRLEELKKKERKKKGWRRFLPFFRRD